MARMGLMARHWYVKSIIYDMFLVFVLARVFACLLLFSY